MGHYRAGPSEMCDRGQFPKILAVIFACADLPDFDEILLLPLPKYRVNYFFLLDLDWLLIIEVFLRHLLYMIDEGA